MKMNVTLTIQEKLKDLRVARGLGLEELAAATGISKSSLGKYESDDYKDISPFNLVKLAEFYGVSTDYLLGLTEQKNHPNAEVHELHLSDDMLDMLKNRVFNNRLLCEMAAHKDFPRLMTDIEVYVDRIASMSIQQLDDYMDTIREKVQAGQQPEQQDPRKVDLYIRTLELAHVREDEYFAYTIHNDIDGIIRDIREAHKKDVTTADEGTPSRTFALKNRIPDEYTIHRHFKIVSQRSISHLPAVVYLIFDSKTIALNSMCACTDQTQRLHIFSRNFLGILTLNPYKYPFFEAFPYQRNACSRKPRERINYRFEHFRCFENLEEYAQLLVFQH